MSRIGEALRWLSEYLGEANRALMPLVVEVLMYNLETPLVKLMVEQSVPQVENSGYFSCADARVVQTISAKNITTEAADAAKAANVMDHYQTLHDKRPFSSTILAPTAPIFTVYSSLKARNPIATQIFNNMKDSPLLAELFDGYENGMLKVDIGGFPDDAPASIKIFIEQKETEQKETEQKETPPVLQISQSLQQYGRKVVSATCCFGLQTEYEQIPVSVHMSLRASAAEGSQEILMFYHKLQIHSIAVPFILS
jgi:hypothetical protein